MDFIRFEYEDIIGDYKNQLSCIQEENKMIKEQLQLLLNESKIEKMDLKNKVREQRDVVKQHKEANMALAEKLNTLMMANFQLQEKLEKEKRKGILAAW